MNKYNVKKEIIKELLTQIGAYMKDRRLEKKLTQVQLAKQMNVLDQHISRIENGKIGYTMEFFLSWCAHLDINPFLIPLHIINAMDRATFNNIEQMSTAFVMFNLRPWIRKIEKEFNEKLFLQLEKDEGHFVRSKEIDPVNIEYLIGLKNKEKNT